MRAAPTRLPWRTAHARTVAAGRGGGWAGGPGGKGVPAGGGTPARRGAATGPGACRQPAQVAGAASAAGRSHRGGATKGPHARCLVFPSAKRRALGEEGGLWAPENGFFSVCPVCVFFFFSPGSLAMEILAFIFLKIQKTYYVPSFNSKNPLFLCENQPGPQGCLLLKRSKERKKPMG